MTQELTISRHAHMTMEAPPVAIDFLQGTDVADATRRCRVYHLAYFLAYLQQIGKTYDTATEADIIQYKGTLIARQYAAKTQCAYITTVKRFYSWCSDHGKCANPASEVEVPDAENKFIKMHLTENQLVRLLDSVKKDKRLLCMVMLMAFSGLRSKEVCLLNIEDIQKRYGSHVVYVYGKGRTDKSEWVPLTPETVEALKDYLRTERPMAQPGDPLFISTSHNKTRGQRIGTRTIRGLVKSSFKAIGLSSPLLTCHSLRHTCATLMLSHGMDIYTVSRIMRHHSINTTKIYLKSNEDEQLLKNPVINFFDEYLHSPIMADEVDDDYSEVNADPVLLDWS